MAATHAGNTVSVAMTTYNGAQHLEEQLLSILTQTLQPSEIIITDDASTDDTIQIIQRLQESYPIIRYVVNEQRLGVVNNFKKAVSLTGKSDFIALADQDDIWLSDKLERLSLKLSDIDDHKHPSIVYSDMILIDEKGNMRNTSFWNELGQDDYRHSFETLLLGNFVTGCTVLMNKVMRDHFANMPSGTTMHDAWLALVAFATGNAGVVKEPLVKYRSHANNVIFSKNAYRKKNKIEKLLNHFRKSIVKNNFLERQIAMVELFYQQYSSSLSPQKTEQIHRLLQLKHKSYLRKMMVFRKVLKISRLKK